MENRKPKFNELSNKPKEKGSEERPKDPVDELIEKLKNIDLKDLSDRDIFHPKGYGSKLAETLEIQTVQLRRIYQELKSLNDDAKKEGIDKVAPRLYKLYAIVEYQAGRGIIKGKFKNLVHKMLDNIERHIGKNENTAKENLKRAYDLMMAIVAYSKKGG